MKMKSQLMLTAALTVLSANVFADMTDATSATPAKQDASMTTEMATDAQPAASESPTMPKTTLQLYTGEIPTETTVETPTDASPQASKVSPCLRASYKGLDTVAETGL